MITRTFKLCLNAGTGSAPYINVSQYDEGETWLFELYSETGERYIPTTGAIVGVKSDGHGIANTGTVDSEGRVVITETQQMTASAGRAIYELSIDGLTHGTANFIVAVERKPTDDAVMSDSDLSLIQEAIDSAEVIVEVIGDGDPSEVIGEHVDAWLDAHPEATTTVLDGAITAPKINQSLWDKLLVSEEASGAVASFDDGADDVPVSSLKVALEPVQLGSGDPSPSNIRPIIASNGKNTLAPWVTSQTLDGITWTANSDGTFTTSGTASASSQPFSNNFTLPVGSYVLSGCPSGGSSSTYFLRLLIYNASNTLIANYSDYGSGVSFTLDTTADHLRIFASVNSGKTAPSGIWKPMIRLASITDSSYQPYQGIAVQQNGKNLFDNLPSNIIEGASIATVSGADITNSSTSAWASIRYEMTLPAGAYTVSVGKITQSQNNVQIQVAKYSGGTYTSKTTLTTQNSSANFTTTENETIRISLYSSVANNPFTASEVMIRLASVTDSTYVPYQSASYPYTLGQSVYGGTVDLATGVLTVTHEIYTVSAVDSLATKTGFIRVRSTNPTAAYVSNTNEKNAITNNMVFNYAGIIGFNGNTSVPFSFFVAENYTYFVLPTSAATDVATANTWFANNPTTVVYPLATPTTVQLTPQEVKTLLGYNNISSTGTVEVIYHADTKLYVDKMTAVDNAIIAPTEETFTTTRNYTTNDLVIVNDTLYKVTANIASGSAITPNSNVQQTTLGALIKALS